MTACAKRQRRNRGILDLAADLVKKAGVKILDKG